MRIERPNSVQPVNPYRQQEQRQEETRAYGKRDQLEISSEALEMQRDQETEAERAARIGELKEQVQGGTYQVDAKRIAEKLLRYEL
ncbi:FlgM family anti-sigma-28 factor [Aneurinibacillus soli]|uniref:Negative regulator of flagellin synthesis n=1 Tax=Aneurinibacillus soli TaxID=1500254 RepID=A0A0U5ARV9_9BACL|nr:flagellar biosynthesis anti-sigma factor FlgM [Aneurinibacillus soli]PYE61491.1 FlgM family anti-sigma-28 factor [Aneurinibacillus soli]BAU26554.1 Anti-sigma-28 factor, FlgM [Aneurinibacillus soli]